jgi:hypothetical protein
MSFFTCFCDLLQNEHLRSSPLSPNFATTGLPCWLVLPILLVAAVCPAIRWAT